MKKPPSSQKTPAQPFDIDAVIQRVREAVAPYPPAAMFDLADRGHDTPFEQLVGCILSIRTRDEVTLPTALSLFKKARTPAKLARLSVKEIEELIRPCAYHEVKAPQLHALATRILNEFDGELPCDLDTLLTFRGVGPKCAHLALGIACGEQRISVDIHVHRITNRWGYVHAPTPEKTTLALEQVLPRKYWVEINKLLVPFGKHICTGVAPKCSTCPILEMCQQVGVKKHR
jgi:endonuclease-3